MELIGKKENIFGDNIAFVENWDFSKANMNEENRILAVTGIASICYNNPKNVGSESLYNRLMTEAHSLPSSSAEFVPILFNYEWICNYIANYSDVFIDKTNILKYGEIITHNGEEYLLTNFRALVYDVEKIGLNKEILKQYNTEEECEIIKQYFKVFKYKVDLPTRSQMVRHRADIQELSRRYVSGKRKEFEFYVSDKMKEVMLFDKGVSVKGSDVKICFTIQDLNDLALKFYNQALEQGVKPEEARRILPQACYTELWMAFQPKYLENFFNLRLDSHSQKEIRSVGEAMKELI
jgi:thymidylate synthase (FAD)